MGWWWCAVAGKPATAFFLTACLTEGLMDDNTRRLKEDAELLNALEPSDVCRVCGQSFPLTAQYWYRDARNRTGYSRRCKICNEKSHAKRSKQQARLMERYAQRLDTKLMKAVWDELKASDRTVEGLPHLARAVEFGLHLHGGLRGYLARIYANACAAPPGSKIRLEYDRMMWSAISKLTEMGQVKIPTDLLSDDDLKQEMEKQLRLIAQDGSVTTADPLAAPLVRIPAPDAETDQPGNSEREAV
jgi:hypothetical protein